MIIIRVLVMLFAIIVISNSHCQQCRHHRRVCSVWARSKVLIALFCSFERRVRSKENGLIAEPAFA